MPDRILRDELLTSPRYWAVSIEAQRLFVHLVLCADDTARFSGKNYTIRVACFPGHPIDPNKLEKLLLELLNEDLIRLYEVDGERFIFIPRSRQRLRYRNSKYPSPPKEISDIDVEKSDSGQSQVGLKSAEVKRSEEKRSKAIGPRATRFAPDSPFPDEWVGFCKRERPHLDPSEVFRKFRDHYLAAPGQKGVRADWDATWRNWVRREQRQFA